MMHGAYGLDTLYRWAMQDGMSCGSSMNKQKIAELRAGLETGFINSGYNSSLAYQPQFLSNNHKEGKKVLSSIEDELMSCDKFQISVAFITMGGITPLLQTLKELEKMVFREKFSPQII